MYTQLNHKIFKSTPTFKKIYNFIILIVSTYYKIVHKFDDEIFIWSEGVTTAQNPGINSSERNLKNHWKLKVCVISIILSVFCIILK